MTEIEAAERLLRLHRLARRRFDPPVFGDPAMVILLELLIAGRDGRRLSEAGLSDAAGVPPKTAQRFVGALEQEGLIRKARAPAQAEGGELSLTVEGDARLGRLLRDWN